MSSRFPGRDPEGAFQLWYNTTDRLNADYNTRSVGVQTGLEFPISDSARLELRYKISKDTLFDVEMVHVDDERSNWSVRRRSFTLSRAAISPPRPLATATTMTAAPPDWIR